MSNDRCRGHWGLGPVVRLVLASGLLLGSGCVYFNTYYNAQRFFRQAEAARGKQAEEELALSGGERPALPRLSPQVEQLYDKAARKASKVVERHPESARVVDAKFILGRSFYWQGNYAGAAQEFAELEAGLPDGEMRDRARFWWAQCEEGQGLQDEAAPTYRALFQAGRGELAFQSGLRLGEMAFARLDYVVAAQEYQAVLQALPQAPGRFEVWLRLGEALQSLADTSRQAEVLQAFASAAGKGAPLEVEYRARLNAGRALQTAGDSEGALRTFSRLLQESRFRVFEGQTRILIGQHYQTAGDPERALAEYGQVRDDFPQTAVSAMALYRTGRLYLQGFGQLDRAREYLQEVGRERPGSEAAGLAQEMLGYLSRLKQLDERIAKAAAPASAPAATPDSATASTTAVAAPGSADSTAAPPPPPPAQPTTGDKTAGIGPRDREPSLEDDLLEAAELYRDPLRLAVPDSALRYYEEALRLFPASEQVPRVLYSIGWVHGQMRGEPEPAAPYLQRLMTEFPGSEHARAARELLGLAPVETAEAAAARAFRAIEERRLLDPKNVDRYIPALDSLAAAYPRTDTAAKAAFLAACALEDVLGDTAAAEARFQQLAQVSPTSLHGRLAEERGRARAAGLLAKLERSLKGVGGQTAPGERIQVIAVEPDSLDSTVLARKELGFALRAQRRGDLKLAREFYERSLEQREGQPEVLYRLGQVMQEQGFREDAQDYYRRALALAPGLIKAGYRLFATFVTEGKADSASLYLRQIVNRDNRNPQVARLLEERPELGDQDKAVDLDLEALESLELDPPDDPLILSLADVLSEPPLVREVVRPRVPEAVAGDSAEVLVDLLVGPGGGVERAEVFRGEEALWEPALEAARRYAFYPALDRSDHEVRVWVELTVPFGGSEPRSGQLPSGAPPVEVASPVPSSEVEPGSVR